MVRITPAGFRQKLYSLGQRAPQGNVAYFCMEYGLRSNLPIYSGGLGVLAGDTVKSAADLGLPMFAIGLLYRDGYVHQSITDGRQTHAAQGWDPNQYPGLVDLKDSVAIPIGGHQVQFRLWGYEVKGHGGHIVPLILLDSLGANNIPGYDLITSQLYKAGSRERLLQDMALGIGGVEVLKWCDIPVAYYHLNEGHAAFAIVQVLKQLGKSFEELTPEDLQSVRQLFSFTTHTPVPAGFDKFHVNEVREVFSDAFQRTAVLGLGKDPKNLDYVNMALLAMRMSAVRNGVSILHAKISEGMFPEHTPIIPVTNGVHHLTWTAPATAKLLDSYCPGWKEDPTKLNELSGLKDNAQFLKDFWRAHQNNKKRLIRFIQSSTGVKMKAGVFTVGFARRFATYKRGDLIFTNEQELLDLAEELGGLQLVFAGKAHPADGGGQGIIAHVIEAGKRLTEKSKGKISFVFLPDYNMEIGEIMTAGVDIWLNTPLRPNEASGTSGMKAALDGVPHMSTEDGWWVENRGGGWTVGDKALEPNDADPALYKADSASLYSELREAGLAYRSRGANNEFVHVMLEALAGNGAYFNTHRMVSDYADKVWRRRFAPAPAISGKTVEEKRSAQTLMSEVAGISYQLATLGANAKVEAAVALSLIANLAGCFRVTRYDAHRESVKIERRWTRERFEGVVFEEIEVANGGFNNWRQREDFAGEVMAHLFKTHKLEYVPQPEKDSRCYRDGKLVSENPFILVPEIVDGEITGVYKLDFHPEQLRERGFERMFIETVMEIAGQARAEILIKDLDRDFSSINSEDQVINWALSLMTAGGFVDMPRSAIETNRVAIFLVNEKGQYVGKQAIGSTTHSEYWDKLGLISQDLFANGVQAYLRGLDQSGDSLNQHVAGKEVGENIVYSKIMMQDGIPVYDHTEFNGSFDTRKLAEVRERVESLLAIEGQRVDNYLLLPILGPDGNIYGMVYVDNVFSQKPLLADQYMKIIDAAVKRIVEIRAAAVPA